MSRDVGICLKPAFLSSEKLKDFKNFYRKVKKIGLLDYTLYELVSLNRVIKISTNWNFNNRSSVLLILIEKRFQNILQQIYKLFKDILIIIQNKKEK